MLKNTLFGLFVGYSLTVPLVCGSAERDFCLAPRSQVEVALRDVLFCKNELEDVELMETRRHDTSLRILQAMHKNIWHCQKILFRGSCYYVTVGIAANANDAARYVAQHATDSASPYEDGIWRGGECPVDTCWHSINNQPGLAFHSRMFWATVHHVPQKAEPKIGVEAHRANLLHLADRLLTRYKHSKQAAVPEEPDRPWKKM